MTLPLPPISPRVDNPAVVVIGGANIDQKCQTLGTVVMGTSNPGTIRTSSGGVGRNVAENLARLDVTTALVTALGDDTEGDRLRCEADAAGVDLRHIIVTQGSTGLYSAVVNDAGEMIIAISAMQAMDAISAGAVDARRALIANARILVLDCNVPVEALVRAAQIASGSGVHVVVDPVSVPKAAGISELLASGMALHTVTPNLDELHELTGVAGSSRADLCAAAAQLHAAGVANVWIRLGVNGSFLSLSKDGAQRVEMIAASPATLVDATGAGDAMLAGYIAGLLRGLDEFAAARLGRAAAAITIESRETVSPLMNLSTLLDRANGHAEAHDG